MQRQFVDLLAITLKEILTEGIDQKCICMTTPEN